MALLLAFIMAFGVLIPVLETPAASARAESQASPVALTSVRGSDYRNLTLNPGATNSEMRFTWHSGSPTGSIVITNPTGSDWILTSVGIPAEAHAGVAASMGIATNVLPTRPGFTYYVHQVSVYDLQPETEYAYKVTWDVPTPDESDPKVFRTGGSDSFTFLVAGDPQIGTGDGLTPTGTAEATIDGYYWGSTLELAANLNSHADFVLSVGDQVHSSNSVPTNPDAHVAISQYRHDRMFASSVLHSLPLMGVVGNHDGWSFDNNNANPRLWPMHYNIPAPDAAGSVIQNEGYGGTVPTVFRYATRFYTQFDYWVVWGNTLFIVLDSNVRTMGAARLEFFNDAVEANRDDVDWMVVTFHHPAYCVYRRSAPGFTEKNEIVNNWIPHFESAGIDIVLNGHAHVYNRTHQMYGNQRQLEQQWIDGSGDVHEGEYGHLYNAVLDPEGIVYFVFNSASGSGYYNVTGMPREYISVYNQNFRRNFSVANVTPEYFEIATYQINDDGTTSLVDVYTVVRSDATDNVPAGVTPRQMENQTFERLTTPDAVVVSYDSDMTYEWLDDRLPADVGVETNLFSNVGGNLDNRRPASSSAYQAADYGDNVRTPRALVTWAVEDSDFDPEEENTQNFKVTGTVAELPRGIDNSDNLPLTVEIQVTIIGGDVVLPGDIARWMAYGRPNPNPENLPPPPGGMDHYFWSINTNGTNVRVGDIPATYGPDNQAPLRFMVGNTQRLFNWNSGAPTVTTGTVVPSYTGVQGIGAVSFANNVRWETTISTAGRAGIEVEFDIRSDPSGTGATNNGPRDWQLEFSLDGTNWLPAGAPIVDAGAWRTILRQLPEAANDQETVHIRWRMTSDAANGGGVISATARHHMRNIVFSSTRPLIPCAPDCDCEFCFVDPRMRIDVLMFNDFHGHVEAEEPVPDNPGAARLTAYIEYIASQNPSGRENVIVVGGGDDFHGYAVSTLLDGEPTLAMMGYLAERTEAQSDSGLHVALGNHEFSFGVDWTRALELDERVTLLAADLFYADPNAPTDLDGDGRPDFVRPYDIVEFPDHEITIALVGLMSYTTPQTVSGWASHGFEARTPGPMQPQEYTDAIADLIADLRDPNGDYGVSAVIGVTHMPGTHATMTYVANNLDFDALVGGHLHVRTHREVNGVPIIEAAHAGRAIGRFSLLFCDDGNLEEVNSWLSPVGAIASFTRPFAAVAGVAEYYDDMTDIIQPFLDATYEELRGPRGPHGVYFNDRSSRDMWVSRLVVDYVTRWSDAQGGPTDWIGISNGGGWRNTGFWPRNADQDTTLAQLISTMPFDNNILLFQMHGQDVLSLINASGLTGTQVRSGIHQSGSNWYVTSSGERIENNREQVFNVIGSNFIFGGLGAGGGDNYPWPGNTRGIQMGMQVLDTDGPLVVMQDGTSITWNELMSWGVEPADWEELGVSMLRTALLDSTDYRRVTQNEEWQAELTVSAEGGGSAVITSPFAPGDGLRNMNIIPQWVTVTATGTDFRGWFNEDDPESATPISTELVYSFTITEDTHLEARFDQGDNEAITVTQANAVSAGTGVTVRGVATAYYLPGTGGSGIFIQDPDSVPVIPGQEGNRGILVRVGVSDSTTLWPFIGQLVEVTGVRQGPAGVAGNGFVNVANITTIVDDIEVITAAALPNPVPVTLLQLINRDYQSMLVSITDPVQIASATTGAGGDPNRALANPATGNALAFDANGNIVPNVDSATGPTSFIVWPDPLSEIPAGEQALINRAVVHFWNARTEVQLRLLNPATDIEPVSATVVNKAALYAALNNANALIEANFTPESWVGFSAVVSTAQAVYDNANATQEQVDSATTSLQSAIAALLPVLRTITEINAQPVGSDVLRFRGFVTNRQSGGTVVNRVFIQDDTVEGSAIMSFATATTVGGGENKIGPGANLAQYVGYWVEVVGVRSIWADQSVQPQFTVSQITVLSEQPSPIVPMPITDVADLRDTGMQGMYVSFENVLLASTDATVGLNNNILGVAGSNVHLRFNLSTLNPAPVAGDRLNIERAAVHWRGTDASGNFVVWIIADGADISIAPTPISNLNILLTAPVLGATPVTTIENTQWTVTVTWSPTIASGGAFAPNTDYTASITITPKEGFTADGILANTWTVNGTATTHAANATTVTFTFPTTERRQITDAAINVTSEFTFTGVAQTPVAGDMTVTLNSQTLVYGTHFTTIAASNNINAGTATVTIQGMGDFIGTATGIFTIARATPTLANLNFTLPAAHIYYDGSAHPVAVTARANAASAGVGAITVMYSRDGGTPTTAAPRLTGLYTVTVNIAQGENFTAITGLVLGTLVIVERHDHEREPNPPVGLTVSDVGHDRVTLTWAAPSFSGSSAITHYEISVNGGSWQDVGANLTTIITGLSPDTAVTIRVRAVNREGYSDYVYVETRTLPDPATPPPPPPPPQEWLPPLRENHFGDVPDYPHWQNNPVSWAYRNNITSGVGDGSNFNPNGNLTRAMFATFLHRIDGLTVASSAAGFSDSGTVSWWAVDAVNWAAEVGVVQGFDDNTFRPSNNISRQQIAVMLFRYAGILELDTSYSSEAFEGFPDTAQVSDWAEDAMQWATHHGLITGQRGNMAPRSNATRAETVTMLQRFVERFDIPVPQTP